MIRMALFPFKNLTVIRDAVLRWNTQQQMNVVRQCIALHQLDLLLPAKLVENLPDLHRILFYAPETAEPSGYSPAELVVYGFELAGNTLSTRGE